MEKKQEVQKENEKIRESLIEAVKEQTKAIADLTSIVKTLKETHDKWVKAGKF